MGQHQLDPARVGHAPEARLGVQRAAVSGVCGPLSVGEERLADVSNVILSW